MRLVIAILLLSAPLAVRAEDALPTELEGIEIVERPGAAVPQDVSVVNQAGERATLGSYFDDGKPVVLALAYYRCPMLCSMVLNGLTQGLKGLVWNAGESYRVLVVSIDPRDTPVMAARKREAYLTSYGRAVAPRGMEFLTTDEASVRRLAEAVGFKYRWDTATEQYAHAAGAFVLTPQGKVSQTLYGITFKSETLRLALTQASAGKLGGAWDRVLLLCFHYDANARGYVLGATRVMRIGGLLTLLLVALGIGTLFRRELHRAAPHAEQSS